MSKRKNKCASMGDSYNKFIVRAKKKHGDKFTYDESSYTNASSKMEITCPIHGVFKQALVQHVRLKHGCSDCGFESSKKHSSYDLDKFLEKAKEIHGDIYGYSEVIYINSTTKVRIYCNKHKFYFEQEPASHLRGRGCPSCGGDRGTDYRRMSPEEIKERVTAVYGDVYDYSNVIWTTLDTKVTLICPEHGEFEKTPRDIIYAKSRCAKCSGNHQYSTEEYVEKATLVHDGVYDYSKVIYTKASDKITIICKEHGEFDQVAGGHLSLMFGCPECGNVGRPTTEEFIELSKKIHGDTFTYENVIYVNMRTKVDLTCVKHGSFLKNPGDHIYSKSGCSICSSSKGELCVGKYLKELNLEYITEYKIPRNNYRYDFYLPKYNLFIEFHGIQHYKFVEFFHRSKEEFNHQKLIDDFKKDLVKTFSGKLIVVHYKLLEKGLVEKFLKRQLIRHGVITSE